MTNRYTYYKNGLKKTFTGPDGIPYAYSYDDNNQLTGVNIPGAGYITYSSYKWNRPIEVILPGGSKREYAYDPLMRVKSITAKDPAQNFLLNYQYNYDKMDNITAKVTEHGEYGYGYDELYRLTGADNPVQADEGFTYDTVGNRLTAAGVADDWSYNDNNELQSYDNVAFEYDANGNMTKKTDAGQVTSYIYNVEDRLKRVEDGSGSLISSYYYDPFGRRLWKEVNGVRTYFAYADEGLVAEVDAAGNVTKSYGYKPGSIWTTDPLFMKVGGQYYFYQNDHLGTPQKLTAVDGAVVWSAKNSSFGEAEIDPTSSVTNNLRFAGQYYDNETGLHYNWHRYYDSLIGRYLRVDPLKTKDGDNLFSYVKSNPIMFLDPKGLARYNVYWHMTGFSLSFRGCVKVTGVVVSMEKSTGGPCKGCYEAVDFEGWLCGASIGLPIGGTYNNNEIFEDEYEEADVRRIQGGSWVFAGSASLVEGASGGGYNFGELTGTNEEISRVEGYEFGVDLVGGFTWMSSDVFCVPYPYLD